MTSLNDLIQFLINALSLGSLYALMALGLAIVYGIMRLVNFAYGELVMVGGYTLLVVGAGPLPWLFVGIMAVLVALIFEGMRGIENAVNMAQLLPFSLAGLTQLVLSVAMILILIFRPAGIMCGRELVARN